MNQPQQSKKQDVYPGQAYLRQGEQGEASVPQTRGVVITRAWRYDLLLEFGFVRARKS